MFYYLYEIKNLINGKIYVGVHKTKNLDDGYMGSGKVICAAIAKYGIDNFTKTILEQFDNSTAMFAREKEVVTEEFLLREDVYNLRRGGTGGFDYIHATGIKSRLGSKWSQQQKERFSASQTGHAVSDQAREKISEAHRGVPKPGTSAKLTGRIRTAEHSKKISAALAGKVYPRKDYPKTRKSSPRSFETVVCPHCGISGKANIMPRWHFDKCKNKI